MLKSNKKLIFGPKNKKNQAKKVLTILLPPKKIEFGAQKQPNKCFTGPCGAMFHQKSM